MRQFSFCQVCHHPTHQVTACGSREPVTMFSEPLWCECEKSAAYEMWGQGFSVAFIRMLWEMGRL